MPTDTTDTEKDAEQRLIVTRQLVREAVIHDIDLGLSQLKKLIEQEYSGILHKITAPLVYTLYVKGKLRSDAIKQVDLVLDAAMEYDGIRAHLDALTDKYFDAYFRLDLVNHHLKHDHPLFEVAREIIWTSFRARIVPAYHVLHQPEGNTYNALIKNTYETPTLTRRALEEHYVLADKVIDLIESHPDVLKGPVYNVVYLGRNLNIIRAGYQFAMEYLDQRLRLIFPELAQESLGGFKGDPSEESGDDTPDQSPGTPTGEGSSTGGA